MYDPHHPLTSGDHPSTALYNAPPSHHDPHPAPFQIASDPRPHFLGPALYEDLPHTRDSLPSGSDYTSSLYALNDPASHSYRDDSGPVPLSPSRFLDEKNVAYAPTHAKSRRGILVLVVLTALILVIAAVIIPVYFTVIKPKTDTGSRSGSSSSTKTAQGATPTQVAIVTGGDGSTVTMNDGTTFTYNNKFGGYWYFDENDPFNNGARAQSWTPALNETFNYGTDKIRGVNIGGWLNTEPFMQVSTQLSVPIRNHLFFRTPALFEPFANAANPAIDEWTLSANLAANGQLQSQLVKHYQTFITEQDFAEIAASGLNFVRIALPYWAIEVRAGEPFLPQVSWTYFLKGIQWARKYGLRINLDFHALPGSQNGWNHSGRYGTINVLNGPMGFANAQRSLDYIRILAEFISQPQYRDVVTLFGIVNEPAGNIMGHDVLASFYLEAYNIVRKASGTGTGMGPYISIHDGFTARAQWFNFLPNGDRLAIDSHPYVCFGAQSAGPIETFEPLPCQLWAQQVNQSMAGFGLTTAGEFSNAVNDCGLYVNGVNLGSRFEGTYPGFPDPVGDCAPWLKWENWDQDLKAGIMKFALASMDALQNYFFWTWKIGNSTATGTVQAPAWSYQLGLQNGWMPLDPRQADGACGNTDPWTPPLQPWQTGGAGAGNIPAAALNNYPWPPPYIANAPPINQLPAYKPIGPVPTLPPPTFTSVGSTQTANSGNGWNNPADQAEMYVEIPGCQYLDPWCGPNAEPPPPCPGN
ncbi:exo-beta-1,3-glucanase [Amanita rubescens]|nr:exo-beta-1,3-glucanase [Amanita rubescens]